MSVLFWKWMRCERKCKLYLAGPKRYPMFENVYESIRLHHLCSSKVHVKWYAHGMEKRKKAWANIGRLFRLDLKEKKKRNKTKKKTLNKFRTLIRRSFCDICRHRSSSSCTPPSCHLKFENARAIDWLGTYLLCCVCCVLSVCQIVLMWIEMNVQITFVRLDIW